MVLFGIHTAGLSFKALCAFGGHPRSALPNRVPMRVPGGSDRGSSNAAVIALQPLPGAPPG